MINATFFERAEQFAVSLSSVDPKKPQESFSALFPKKEEFDNPEQLQRFIDTVAKFIIHEKLAKTFSVAISEEVLKKVRKLPNEKVPEVIRAFINIRYCDLRNLYAEKTSKRMKKAEITQERLRYRFATHVAKRKAVDFMDKIHLFQIFDSELNRKLVQIVLDFDVTNVFLDFKAFNLPKEEKDLCYLRTLVRSPGRLDEVIYDGDFLESQEKTSTPLLEEMYQQFQFGKTFIEELIFKVKSSFTPSYVFARLIKEYGESETLEKEFGECPCIFEKLEDTDLQVLVAILLLLRSHDEGEILIKNEKMRSFLKEISQVRDPFTRFAATTLVALFLKRGHLPTQIFGHPRTRSLPPDTYPYLCSVVLYAFEFFCPGSNTTPIISKWKDIEFRKQISRFLAELLTAERITSNEKMNILLRFLSEKDLQSGKVLIDFHTCLVGGFVKPLLQKKLPTSILQDNIHAILNAVGKPFECELAVDLLPRLKILNEFGFYAQKLDQLPYDEKELIIPFFFDFLKFLATGELEKERYLGQSMHILFGLCEVNADEWKKPYRMPINNLVQRFPGQLSTDSDPFDIQAALNLSLQHQHLPKEYEAFKQCANLPTDGKEYNACKGSKEISEQKRAAFYLLNKLLHAQTSAEQLKYIQAIEKSGLFLSFLDFQNDLKNWKKTLNKSKQAAALGESNYFVIKTHDPYLLFQIGSVAGDTCLRVTGDPAKNKCLLAYPLDGKNCAIVIQDTNEEVKARAILRFFLVYHIAEITPVLYLEPVYPGGATSYLKNAILLLALDCAQKLRVPLIRHLKPKEEKKPSKWEKGDLRTIPSRAPFEYFDGIADKIISNRRYSTTVAQVGWDEIQTLYHPNDANS